MPHFAVGLTQMVAEECTVTVEAANAAEAEEKALALAYEGNVEWSFLQAGDGIDVASVRLVPPCTT